MLSLCFLKRHAYLLVIISLANNGLSEAKTQQGYRSRWFHESGFRLSSRVRVFTENQMEAQRVVYMQELYSNQEQRAKLVVKPIKSEGRWLKFNPELSLELAASKMPDESVFHFDNENKRSVLLRSLSKNGELLKGSCRLSGTRDLSRDIFGSIGEDDEAVLLSEWLAKCKEAPDHVIGLARFHFMVVANRELLSATLMPQVNIRNLDTIQYNLDLPIGKLSVYYGKADDPTTGEQVPIRAWLRMPHGTEIIMDFSQITPLGQDTFLTLEEHEDLFAFPLGVGCSAELPEVDLFAGQPMPRVLSFRAKLHDFVDAGPPLSYFLAFDGHMGVLRRDLLAEPDDGMPYTSVTIHELRRRRKYNYRLEEVTDKSLGISSAVLGDLHGKTPQRETQCVFTKVVGQKQALDPPLKLTEGLKAMGVARVRDVETVVFEQQVDRLPAALFPLVQYKDERGELRSVYLPQGRTEQHYYIHYYVARGPGTVLVNQDGDEPASMWHSGQPLGALMRLEVTQDKFLVYRVEVEDFSWALNESPNGDSPSELFSLQDRCINLPIRPESQAELRLDLEFRLAEQPHEQPSTAEALIKLASPNDRRLGLMRALTNQSKYTAAVMISGLESKLRFETHDKPVADYFRFKASMQLQLPRQPIYRAISVGRGLLRSAEGRTEASTFDECFWEAAHLQKLTGNEVLFTFCFERCLIDTHVGFTADGSKLVKSSLFLMNNNEQEFACQLLRFEVSGKTDEEDESGDSDLMAYRSFWMKLKLELADARLELPLEPVEPRADHIALLVKSVTLTNEQWAVQLDDLMDLPPDKRNPLDGFGLPYAFASVVSPPSGGQMSDAICRSSCLNSDKCRSYSVCATRYGIECLISELDFRFNEDVLSQLAKAAKNATKVSVDFKLPPTSDSDSDSDDGQQSELESLKVEIRADRRCRIRSKRVLELFSRKSDATLRSLRGQFMVAANSEEHCAQMCFKNNVHFLRSLKKKNERLAEAIASAKTAAEASAKVALLPALNLRSWCSTFMYYDFMGKVPYLPSSFQKQLGPEKLSKRGLCFKPRLAPTAKQVRADQVMDTKVNQSDLPDDKPEILVRVFNFLYENLFEPVAGQRLLPKTPLDKSVSELGPAELAKFNFQKLWLASDPEDCARACFTQSSGLWPSCRSFLFAKKYPATSSYCVLNSMTLAQAMASDQPDKLIVKVKTNERFTHYEPRDKLGAHGFSLRPGADLERQLAERPTTSESHASGLNLTGVLLVLGLALVSGLGIVQLLARRLNELADAEEFPSNRRESVEFPSSSFLSSLLVGDNRVTHRRFEPEIDLPDIINANADAL